MCLTLCLIYAAAERFSQSALLNPPLGARTTSARANDGQAEIRSAASPEVACEADQGLALSGMAQTTPWVAEGLTLSSREEKLAHYLLSRGIGSRAARPAGRPSADPAARTRAPIGRDAGAAPAALRHEILDAPRPRGLKSCGEPPQDPSKNDD